MKTLTIYSVFILAAPLFEIEEDVELRERAAHWTRELENQDVKVRKEALQELVKIGYPGLIGVIKALNDVDQDVRLAAASGLDKIYSNSKALAEPYILLSAGLKFVFS